MSGKPLLFTRTTTPDLLGTLMKGKNYKRKLREGNYKRQEALAKVSGNYYHPLIFEYWLADQGVDTKVFWKNCKSKYNGSADRRKLLRTNSPKDWVIEAFEWEDSLETIAGDGWYWINAEWGKVVTTTQDNNRTILFGFGKYGDFK